MRLSLLPRVAVAIACFATMSASVYAAVPDRIAAVSSSRTVLRGTVVPRAARAKDLGLAAGSTALTSMTLRFSLTDAQNVALATLESAQQNAASASYHQWLSPEQYAERFGLSTGDVATVTAWLTAQGFQNVTPARSRSFVTFSGTAAQVQAAFGAAIHNVSENGETHFANLTEPTMPTAFAGVVSAVTGLNDFHLRARAKMKTVPTPQFTSSISGNTFIAPGDFYTIYDINPLLNSSINGSGITIGVMGQTDIALTDIAAFRSASGLPANAPTIKLYGGDPGISQNDLPEASLDVEWSGAVAPAATILYVNSTDVIGGSLTQAIDNNLAPILTISYGDCETGFGSANIATYNALFRQATVQGQTILGPAGDSGATDCDYDAATATQGLAVDFPASSPYVTGVGGTMFNENGGTYFSATNGNYMGSALSYIPEAVWNETALGGGLASGGGGSSIYFTKPSFQVGTGVPADSARDVPDVSFNAAASHDGYLFCVSGFCTNGYRNASNNLDVVGGTSVSTPAYAGIMALLEQKIQARVGNANPTIYGLANSTYYATVFHDVTVGNNDSPCTAGSPGCGASGYLGYNATVGYDLATGWGSVDALQMVNDWLLVSPIGTGTAASSTTSIVASAASVTAGTPVTLNVTVASGTSGVTATPTGTVTLLVDGAVSGSAVTLSGGNAVLTVATTALTSGGHTLTVNYSGDTNYFGSKGSVSLNIVAATTPDFTISPATGTLTVAAGQTGAPVLFTVTPVNGFTGPVNFTATVTGNTLNATGSFNPTTVTLSGTTAGTTTFTLAAFTVSGGNASPAVKRAGNQLPGKPWEVGSGLAMAALLCWLVPGRRRRWTALAGLLISLTMFSVSGCGGSNNFTPIPTTTNSAPGTYTITISATSTTSTHNATLTVVVQ